MLRKIKKANETGQKVRRVILAVAVGILCCQLAYSRPHPEDGAQREYYPNGKIRLETIFKKEHVVRSRTFYDNGRLRSEFRYQVGALLSSRTFYEDGQLRSEWKKSDGIMRFYSRTGQLTNESRLEQ